MSNSITVRLISGIGNNLYQIATLYHYAKINNIKEWSVIYPQHNGQIQEIRPHGGHYTPKIDNIPFFIENIFPNVNWKDKCDINDIVIGSYIFDIPSFWDSIKDIKKILTPNPSLIHYIDSKYENIYSKKTLGIHLRFVSGSDSFLPEKNVPEWIVDILQKEYNNYENILIISNNYSIAKTMISKYFEIGKKLFLIENEPNYVDLFMLSKCDIIICSNSTFSFWSAALSDSNTIYISPEYKPANVRNSIPTSWLTNSEIFYKCLNSDINL